MQTTYETRVTSVCKAWQNIVENFYSTPSEQASFLDKLRKQIGVKVANREVVIYYLFCKVLPITKEERVVFFRQIRRADVSLLLSASLQSISFENCIKYLIEKHKIKLDGHRIINKNSEIHDKIRKLKNLSLIDCRLVVLPTQLVSTLSGKYLTHLDLSNNLLSSLPQNIIYLNKLAHIKLNQNKFEELPKELCLLTNLQSIQLSVNAIKSIPSDIMRLNHLKEFIIKGNLLENIPSEIKFLTKLEKLDLFNNKLKSLPSELAVLRTSLTALDVFNNPLSGGVPDNVLAAFPSNASIQAAISATQRLKKVLRKL